MSPVCIIRILLNRFLNRSGTAKRRNIISPRTPATPAAARRARSRRSTRTNMRMTRIRIRETRTRVRMMIGCVTRSTPNWNAIANGTGRIHGKRFLLFLTFSFLSIIFVHFIMCIVTLMLLMLPIVSLPLSLFVADSLSAYRM